MTFCSTLLCGHLAGGNRPGEMGDEWGREREEREKERKANGSEKEKKPLRGTTS